MNIAVVILTLLMPLIGISQNCNDFKTGAYKCRLEDGEWIKDYKIIRRKKVQIEHSSEGVVKSKVVWIDDCTYRLIHMKSDYLKIPKGNVTTVKILKTKGIGYQAIGSSDAVPGRKRRFEMELIR